jgi:hypothetical protein
MKPPDQSTQTQSGRDDPFAARNEVDPKNGRPQNRNLPRGSALTRCAIERPWRWTARRSVDAPNAHPSAMLVLVPSSFGGLKCFERKKPGPLRTGPMVGDPLELARLVQAGLHHTVVLCGARHRKEVVDAVIDHADLYQVPLEWLRHVPRDDPDEMAAVAAKLITALRTHPIRRRMRRQTEHRLF